MIDTILLTVPVYKAIKLVDRARDSPKWALQSKRVGFEKWVINQTKAQKDDGIYRPRIRFIKRGRMKFFQIEFSAPKLLLGNNVDELSENDFESLLKALSERLKDFGIGILTRSLAEAEVSFFHPSKNILLKNGYTSSFVIKELNKINLHMKMDLTKNRFANEGESLQYYTNSHSLVIYDKVQDLRKPEKRAVDKDQVKGQMSLFDQLDRAEILRIEVRLSSKTKMKTVLAKMGVENLQFKDIFKNNICHKIVSMYWKEIIEDKNKFLFDSLNEPQKILQKVIANKPNIKPKDSIYLVGLNILAKDKGGIRALRGIIEKQGSRRSWYRIAEDLDDFNKWQSNTLHGWVGQIDNQIKEFNPLKIIS